MFEITPFFTRVDIDLIGYKKSLDKIMTVQIRQAAREWLRAVIPRVPVYTGTSRGSLQPLGIDD